MDDNSLLLGVLHFAMGLGYHLISPEKYFQYSNNREVNFLIVIFGHQYLIPHYTVKLQNNALR